MKIIECTGKEDFKRAVKENMEQNIEPILYAKGFVKFRKFGYVREVNGLCQFISFWFGGTGGWKFEADLFYSPIFSPDRYLFSFPVIITDNNDLFEINPRYYFGLSKRNLPEKVSKLMECLNEYLIPLLDDIDSFEKYAEELSKDLKDIRIYRDILPRGFGTYFEWDKDVELNQIFNNCLNGDFEKGKKELENFKQFLLEKEEERFRLLNDKNVLIKFIEDLLTPNENEKELTKESFLEKIEKISMENRIKYKLVKKSRKKKS